MVGTLQGTCGETGGEATTVIIIMNQISGRAGTYSTVLLRS